MFRRAWCIGVLAINWPKIDFDDTWLVMQEGGDSSQPVYAVAVGSASSKIGQSIFAHQIAIFRHWREPYCIQSSSGVILGKTHYLSNLKQTCSYNKRYPFGYSNWPVFSEPWARRCGCKRWFQLQWYRGGKYRQSIMWFVVNTTVQSISKVSRIYFKIHYQGSSLYRVRHRLWTQICFFYFLSSA